MQLGKKRCRPGAPEMAPSSAAIGVELLSCTDVTVAPLACPKGNAFWLASSARSRPPAAREIPSNSEPNRDQGRIGASFPSCGARFQRALGAPGTLKRTPDLT